jgi:hypothetical protein
MATNSKAVAVDETAGSGKGRTRSPAYPFINLETAIKRAQEFYDHEIRNAASLKVAVKHWGYQEKSSGGLQTTAALISFGLMEDEGSGEKRKLKLTSRAIRMLLDKRPDSPDRAQVIKELALSPKLHRDLWDKWGNSLPSEDQVRYTLTAEWEPPFNEKTVDAFIKEYRDTIAFAKLTESDRVASEDGNSSDAGSVHYVPQVGDYVQWESQGTMQFREPAKVLSISTDRTHVFVEGTATGLPVNQLTRADVPFKETLPESARIARLPLPLLPQTNMQEDVFSLSEGRVVIQWPAPLSAESIEDLKDWLKIVERKITRSAIQSCEKQP